MKLSKALLSLLFVSIGLLNQAQAAVEGWLHWRGPQQNGTSTETNLPDRVTVGGENYLWSHDLAGRGSAVVANGRVYAFGYRGEGPDLQEIIACLDAKDGSLIWERGFNDYLSDIVYNRYSVGAATVDAETGLIYFNTSNGGVHCFNDKGETVWEVSLMERFGRLTFPNGRTGAIVIDGDLAIIHAITSYWGADGPARDRFYAFDKKSGDLVWSSTPGVAPKDSSFSSPVLAWANGKRVLYAGTGCGNVVCINTRTGEPLWRFQMSYGGVNSSVLLHDDNKIVAIHGKENIDTTETGRMIGIRTGSEPKAGEKGPVVLDSNSELWRQPLMMFTSSPVLVGDRVFQVTHTGELVCLNANSGEILFDYKLGNGQLHASPLYADGKLYIPMVSGSLFILKVNEDGVELLDEEKLEGECLGSPTVWNGQIYVHTKSKLYCFGSGNGGTGMVSGPATVSLPKGKKGAKLQIVPNDALLEPGQNQPFNVRLLDSNGFVVKEQVSADFAKWIPPTAKVKTEVDGQFGSGGLLTAGRRTSAGAFKATANGLSGVGRARVIPSAPFEEDFEDFELTVAHATDKVNFAYPPLPWIGARFKWEIRDVYGSKALAKTLDRVLFQRAITFFGNPEMTNYTIQADVLTDGNRRVKGNVGLINQRYFISLLGNSQRIEVSSNHDRVKVSERFRWSPKKWYTLKSRVDLHSDGSGVVKAKAWERGTPEPDAWTIEVPHKTAHKKGAPGLIGFAPQSLYRVYVDNVKISQN